MSSDSADVGVNEAPLAAKQEPEKMQPGESLHIRMAQRADAPAMARILVQAFPELYRVTFGDLHPEQLTALMTQLYLAENLSLTTTQVAEREGRVVGLAI